jgi:hypothetical protein
VFNEQGLDQGLALQPEARFHTMPFNGEGMHRAAFHGS